MMRSLLGMAVALAAGVSVASGQEGGTRALAGVVRVTGGSSLPAVVYVPGTRPAAPSDTSLVDQRRLKYVPTITVVPPGSAVKFRNSDPVVHNVFSPTRPTVPFDLGRYGPEEARVHAFGRAGAALILCRIHPEMFAYVLVAEAAAWTQTDAEGRFRLEVPVNETQIVVWHPRAGTRRVIVEPGSTAPLAITLDSP